MQNKSDTFLSERRLSGNYCRGSQLASFFLVQANIEGCFRYNQDQQHRQWTAEPHDQTRAKHDRKMHDNYPAIRSVHQQKQARPLVLAAADVDAFVSSVLDEGRSGSLAAGCLSILRRALNVAVANKVIDENPLPEIGKAIAELPSLTQAEVPSRDAWSHEEAAAILELAESFHRNLYVALEIALGCGGPRRGELLALEGGDID
ncbi:MAG: hypothetical protein IH930_11550, partial [Proteobacteria bacterium]|nr:hypothetical protein [Pseudomonadota bacterium]